MEFRSSVTCLIDAVVWLVKLRCKKVLMLAGGGREYREGVVKELRSFLSFGFIQKIWRSVFVHNCSLR